MLHHISPLFFISAFFLVFLGGTFLAAWFAGRMYENKYSKLAIAKFAFSLIPLLSVCVGLPLIPDDPALIKSREETLNKQVSIFADYLHGKEVDTKDAWWLRYSQGDIYSFFENHYDKILPIINEGQEKKYEGEEGVMQWLEDEGRKKLFCDYTIRLKNEASPPVADQDKQVSEQ